MKRTLSLLLTAVLLLGMLPITAAAAESSNQQISNPGGTVYYDTDGTQYQEGTLGEDGIVVKMTKMVEGTTTENEFIVTLQVQTNQKLTEIPASTPDAAVALAIDVSNSMDDCVNCGKEEDDPIHQGESHTEYYCSGTSGNTYKEHWHSYGLGGRYDCRHCHKTLWEHNEVTTTTAGTCAYRSRLADAQAAALSFLNQFANETGAKEGERRMVAVVSFGSNARRELNWVDIRTQPGMDAAIAAINGVEVAHGNSKNGGTNIEGGLMLAKNLLKAGRGDSGYVLSDAYQKIQGINYLYTILLTDGNPTYHVSNDSSSTSSISGAKGGGSSTTEADAEDVGDEAAAIRSITSLSRLYSICFGKEKNNDGTYTVVWDKKPFGDWKSANPKTTKSTTVGQWLSAFSTEAYNGQATGLFDSFSDIAAQIATAAQAWKVNDEMGEKIEYLEAVPVAGKSSGSYINNAVTFAADGRSFEWNILNSEYDPRITNVVVQDGKMVSGTLGYTYRYRIRLDNLNTSPAAVEDTNRLATLKYMVADTDGNWPTSPDDLKTGEFLRPSVHGMEASTASLILKTDQKGTPQKGA